ncbi:MAG: hypothetical protein WA715_07660 [Candidatus Acidiferrum sp.]
MHSQVRREKRTCFRGVQKPPQWWRFRQNFYQASGDPGAFFFWLPEFVWRFLERRLRLIKDETEYSRVRRLHPASTSPRCAVCEITSKALWSRHAVQRQWRLGPQQSLQRSAETPPNANDRFQDLEKWDATLSQSLQLAEPKAALFPISNF